MSDQTVWMVCVCSLYWYVNKLSPHSPYKYSLMLPLPFFSHPSLCLKNASSPPLLRYFSFLSLSLCLILLNSLLFWFKLLPLYCSFSSAFSHNPSVPLHCPQSAFLSSPHTTPPFYLSLSLCSGPTQCSPTAQGERRECGLATDCSSQLTTLYWNLQHNHTGSACWSKPH